MFRTDRFTSKIGELSLVADDSMCVQRNLDGKIAEKNGDIETAIRLYEQNVSDRFTGSHPYNRLAIIYRKLKRYEDEKRVLLTAIDVYTHDTADPPILAKFRERLAKLEDKMR